MNRTDAINAAMAAIDTSQEDDEEINRSGYVVGYCDPQGWQIAHPGDAGRVNEISKYCMFYISLSGPIDFPETATLSSLIDTWHGNAYTLADRGSGSGIGELGQLFRYDDEVASLYGDIELHALDYPVMNNNKKLCFYASDWQDGLDRDIQPYHNPADYQFRILF